MNKGYLRFRTKGMAVGRAAAQWDMVMRRRMKLEGAEVSSVWEQITWGNFWFWRNKGLEYAKPPLNNDSKCTGLILSRVACSFRLVHRDVTIKFQKAKRCKNIQRPLRVLAFSAP